MPKSPSRSSISILNIRKTSWLAIGLVIVFVGHRFMYPFWHSLHGTAQAGSVEFWPSDSTSLVVCRIMLEGKPFGVDSVFQVGRDRVHVFSQAAARPDLAARWYRGGVLVASTPCASGPLCHSSLGPDSLQEGDWSVDLVEMDHLLASRQFRMISP